MSKIVDLSPFFGEKIAILVENKEELEDFCNSAMMILDSHYSRAKAYWEDYGPRTGYDFYTKTDGTYLDYSNNDWYVLNEFSTIHFSELIANLPDLEEGDYPVDFLLQDGG